MCIYLVISFSCCCYLFLSFYMCSPFFISFICFYLFPSEWVSYIRTHRSVRSVKMKTIVLSCPSNMSAKNVGVHIYNGPSVSLPTAAFMIFNFSGRGRGRRSVRRGGRRLTPLALPVPYTPHLGIASIKTGPKHASIWKGPKMPQSKRGQKQPESWREGVADFSISRRDLRHWLKEAPSEVTACSNGIGDIISFTEISRTGVSEASPKGRPLTLLILLIQSLITYHYEGPSIETKSEHL